MTLPAEAAAVLRAALTKAAAATNTVQAYCALCRTIESLLEPQAEATGRGQGADLPLHQYHENPRPAFPPPAEWGAITAAWEALRDSGFADEGGPLANRHEFLQIGELINGLRQELSEFGSEAYEIMPRYI